MAMKIIDTCIACGVCEPECPRHCITAGDLYVIETAKCTECKDEGGNPKCVAVCPVDCIIKA
jgi:ferredoxin